MNSIVSMAIHRDRTRSAAFVQGIGAAATPGFHSSHSLSRLELKLPVFGGVQRVLVMPAAE
jgi:hypothetical protein